MSTQVEPQAGPGIAEAFRQPEAAQLSVLALERASLSVTEIKLNRNGFGLTDPIPTTDAAMLAVQLRAIPFHEAMTEDRPVPVHDVQSGDTLFYDMRRNPRANVMTPSHSLHFVLHRKLLDEIAISISARRIDGLFPPTGAKVHDRRLARFARSIRPALRRSNETTALFASHFALSLGIYACWRYGGMQAPKQPAGELCKLQIALATEFINANLDGGIELRELASLCGMPAHRFLVAFRETFGMAPYQWLAARRIELGKALTAQKHREIDDIAALCGFADEAHFVDAFERATGATPLNYRAQLQ